MVGERTVALASSEERYRTLFENAADALIVFDLGPRVQSLNRKAVELYGYEAKEIIGKKFQALLPVEQQVGWKDITSQLLTTGVARYETEALSKDGTAIPVEVNNALLQDGQGDIVGTLVIARDTSERKRMEREKEEAQERLLRHERLSAVGQIASGVAHDLRQPLTVINNSIYLLKRWLEDAEGKMSEHLEILGKEVSIANGIIGDMLDFARPRELFAERLEIGPLLREALSRATVPEGIEVIMEVDEPAPIMADSRRLGQVFLNLISNAIQAMPVGGSLIVSASQRDGFLKVDFRDTGIGIPRENLEQIFEPLFSTKTKGSGLGLATAKQIVESHGGAIEIRSRGKGKGTAFTIRIPLAGEMPRHEGKSQLSHSR
ncbi:nitrogen regulation protein NR(II) [Chloroflexota bacterium]